MVGSDRTFGAYVYQTSITAEVDFEVTLYIKFDLIDAYADWPKEQKDSFLKNFFLPKSQRL